MASRMERYYKNELINTGRSDKNKSLYEQIENLDSYTNIEGVATIEKTNEIDISKVKEMLNNRENYKKQQQLRGILKEDREEKKEIEKETKVERKRHYDINAVLSKVKEEQPKEEQKYRRLDDKQYNDLKSIVNKVEDNTEDELKELINTIVSNDSLNQLANEDDVGLLDELKSNTIVGTASSIKKIIDEEKERKVEETSELDNSFYTSSFGFTKKDFEELKNMNHGIKKSNKYIIVLLAILIGLIIMGILFFILK